MKSPSPESSSCCRRPDVNQPSAVATGFAPPPTMSVPEYCGAAQYRRLPAAEPVAADAGEIIPAEEMTAPVGSRYCNAYPEVFAALARASLRRVDRATEACRLCRSGFGDATKPRLAASASASVRRSSVGGYRRRVDGGRFRFAPAGCSSAPGDRVDRQLAVDRHAASGRGDRKFG